MNDILRKFSILISWFIHKMKDVIWITFLNEGVLLMDMLHHRHESLFKGKDKHVVTTLTLTIFLASILCSTLSNYSLSFLKSFFLEDFNHFTRTTLTFPRRETLLSIYSYMKEYQVSLQSIWQNKKCIVVIKK